MSISVLNHNDAVKTKVVICASLVLVAVLSLAEAGPRVGVCVRARGRGILRYERFALRFGCPLR